MLDRRLLLVPSLALLAIGPGCGACASSEDRAAKERIFSPEDPPKVLQAAREDLDAGALGDPALARRVLSMPAQEAVARLGPHVQDARIAFKWTTEAREVRLAETRRVAVVPGGDFHVFTENDQDQGMEWIRVGGVSYARSRHAPFRERRRDRGSSEHVLASGYDALAAFDRLAHGALRLTSGGTTQRDGRTVVKYAVSLGEVREVKPAKPLPEVEFPKGGPDADTKLRLEAFEKAAPTEVEGTLYVDQATAVPLGADLRLAALVEGSQGPTRLDLTVTLAVGGVGRDPKVKVPEHLPDEPRPPGVVATLDAYGVPRATAEADGGTPKPGEGETPPPDEE